MGKLCWSCGEPREDKDYICPQCGAAIQQKVAEIPASAPKKKTKKVTPAG